MSLITISNRSYTKVIIVELPSENYPTITIRELSSNYPQGITETGITQLRGKVLPK
jgi:hypothetical protein